MIHLPLSQPPIGLDWQINRDSPQAKGLIEWAPAARNPQGVSPATGSTVALQGGAVAVADPVMGVAVATPGTNTLSPGEGIATSAPRMDGLLDFTLSFWIKWTSGGGIWSSSLNGAAVQSFIDSAAAGPSSWRVGFRRPDWAIEAGFLVSPLVAGEWVHVCFTRAGTAGVQYKNGVQQTTWVSAGQPMLSTGSGMSLGQSRRGTSGSSQACVSLVADLRLYNRALSAAEVSALYKPQTRWDMYAVPMPRLRRSGAVPYYHILRQTIGAAA